MDLKSEGEVSNPRINKVLRVHNLVWEYWKFEFRSIYISLRSPKKIDVKFKNQIQDGGDENQINRNPRCRR